MTDAMETAQEPCHVCRGSKMLVLDAYKQVDLARRRWQWADLGPGANDCPGCTLVPPDDKKK